VPWLDHPSYVRARDALIENLKAGVSLTHKLPPVVFLCGAKNSHAREHLRQYFHKHKPYRVFFAEQIWEYLAATPSLNSLELESRLATLADIVIIIVESPGALAELGAFAHHEPLRRKLLPVLDAQYQSDLSFINSGPVKWIDQDSIFTPSIWTDLNLVSASVGEIVKRMDKIPKRKRYSSLAAIADNDRDLLLFLVRLVALLEPVQASHVDFVVHRILGKSSATDLHVDALLALAAALDLLNARSVPPFGRLYTVSDASDVTFAEAAKRRFDPNSERARIAGVLQKIAISRAALQIIQESELVG
jgi:hypothetical protein